MTTEVTHVYDEELEGMRQIVPAWKLRELLLANGESLARPDDFGPNDQWEV